MGQGGPRQVVMVEGILVLAFLAFWGLGRLFHLNEWIAITGIASFAVITVAALVTPATVVDSSRVLNTLSFPWQLMQPEMAETVPGGQ